MRRLLPAIILAGSVLFVAAPSSQATPTFVDVTSASGIFVQCYGPMMDFGSGAAFFDCDRDGDLDIYVVMDDGVENRLYLNDGAGQFVDIGVSAGVASTALGKGVTWVDYDNDGYADLFLTNYQGPNKLFRNNGDGTFSDVTTVAGLDYTGPSYGSAWGDYDRDGNLDLYVAVYGDGNLLYESDGDGTFSEVGATRMVNDIRKGFGAAWFDYDNDGDVDLYVINDLQGGNVLYCNNGNGTFSDVSAISGAGVNIAAMGIALADYDRNGYMDVYITNTSEGNVFLHNNGDGTFTDIAQGLGVKVQRTGRGTAFFDYDNDGWDDLYVVNFTEQGGDSQAENVLFRNTGGAFTNVTTAVGGGDRGPGFGLAVGDYDNDGFVDLFVHNRNWVFAGGNWPSVLYQNTPNTNNWIKFELVGRQSNRDGIGTRVRVTTGANVQIKDQNGGMSYLSHHSPLLHFGVGAASTIDEVRITWPSGIEDVYTNVAVNQTKKIKEGQSALVPGTFVAVTSSCGIGTIIATGEREVNGHGASFADYDGDGDLDLYVAMGQGQPNHLYQNNGADFFVDVGPSAGVATLKDGRGVVWADYDNDGDPDCFVANYLTASSLFRNNGDGTFTNVAGFAGVNASTESHSACWADYNNDGWLDLFVGNYGTLADSLAPKPNMLYKSNGDGTFTDIAATAGVDQPLTPALANTWIDYDNDGDLDLYIANDKLAGNALFRNNGTDVFEDVSVASGTDLLMNAMGIAVADYDHDGDFDMYVTNTMAGNAFLRNNGDSTFTDIATSPGTAVNRIGWGCAFLDHDNDGDDDLYVINWKMAGAPLPDPANVFFRNNGNGTFTDVTTALGVGDQGTGYGLTIGDYNNDGFLDMFVHNQNTPSVFYENVPTGNNWIKIRTRGVTSNRDGIGAKIRVVVSGLPDQLKDVRAGSSYLSSLSREVEFGLGNGTTIDQITVTWPSGIVDNFMNVSVNEYVEITEGGSLINVPVFISEFYATPRAGGVELSWTIVSDELVTGIRVHRTEAGRAMPVGGIHDVEGDRRSFLDSDVRPGTSYAYRIGVLTEDGSEILSRLVNVTVPRGAFALGQNFPNPFNPTTSIEFSLPDRTHVRLDIYDAAGRRITTLVDEVREAGSQDVRWDGRNGAGQPVSTGVYFYRLSMGDRTLTRKMMLLK